MPMSQREFDEAYLRKRSSVIERILNTLTAKGPLDARHVAAELMDIHGPYLIIQSGEIDEALPDLTKLLDLLTEKGQLRRIDKRELSGLVTYYSR